MLLNQSLCTERSLIDLYEDRKPRGEMPFGHISYEDMNEDQRVAYALLQEYEVYSVVAKGLSSIRCLDAVSPEGRSFLEALKQYARNGSTSVIAKKSGKNINSLILSIWEMCANGHLKMIKAPDRSMFYVQNKELDDELRDRILNDQDEKKQLRVSKFEDFVSSIEAGDTAEVLIKRALDIGE